MTSGVEWTVVERRTFEALRKHCVYCLLCGTAGPGVAVLVYSGCEPGIVLLTEWFLAKKYAEVTLLLSRPVGDAVARS